MKKSIQRNTTVNPSLQQGLFWYQLYQQAEIAYFSKNYQKALKTFEYLLEHYPSHYQLDQLLVKCGVSAKAQGDAQKAASYFRRSFKLKPSEETAQYLQQLV